MRLRLRDPVREAVVVESEDRRGFGQAAEYYEAHAAVQRFAAQRLTDRLAELTNLPPGPVLEVGCGTGFVSRKLPQIFPGRRLELVDRAEGMVRHCRARFKDLLGESFTIDRADAHSLVEENRLGPRSDAYAVIVAGFVAQWFRDPYEELLGLASALAPGGALVVSVPGSESFPEWRRACTRAGVPFTARALPEAARLRRALASGSFSAVMEETSFEEQYESPLHFFRHLRRLGAAGGSDAPPLPASGFRRLLSSWGPTGDSRACVTYQVLFLIARSPLTATAGPITEHP